MTIRDQGAEMTKETNQSTDGNDFALLLVGRLTSGLELGAEFHQAVEYLFRGGDSELRSLVAAEDLDLDLIVRKALFSLSHDLLLSGKLHTYAGALSAQGRDMLLLNEKCADYFVRTGVWTRGRLDQYRQDLYAELERLG